MRVSKAERDKALTDLRASLTPGMTVYTTLRHRAASGMFRIIDVHVIEDNEPRWLGMLTAKVIGYGYDDRRQGLRVSGTGMDMGFAVVYALSSAVFREGFGCIGERCPSNDHSNGDRNYAPHTEAAPHWHKSGGYALRQRWM